MPKLNATPMHVTDLFQSRKRFLRSAHLEHDWHDHSALDGYVMTPHVKGSLNRLAMGLKSPSTQRAWRITGDYGSGKSSFALLLAHLWSQKNVGLAPSLTGAIDWKQFGVTPPRLLPVLVTGSREPLSIALLRSLESALADTCTRGRVPTVLQELQAALSASDEVTPSDATVLKLLKVVGEHIRTSGKGDGLLLILDELGKFLEFASLHPDRQDVFLLQSLAEAASRSGDTPLFIVGMLHQGFSAYADNLSQTGQKEWEKIAGRFEELVWNQPLEQTAELVADALDVQFVKLSPSRYDALNLSAQTAMKAALGASWYGSAANETALLGRATALYPLHASVLPPLVRLFSRFGQNERSLFNFLLGNEPFGLQDFAARTQAESGTFYQLHDLYDYARTAFGPRFSIQSYRSHWNAIDSIVQSYTGDDMLELHVLKTVGLLNLLDAGHLIASAPVLQLALANSEISISDVEAAITRLQREKRLLYFRGAAGGYCLWPHTSVNLERAYEDAARDLGSLSRVAPLVEHHLDTRPPVARRHYIEKGSLRHFAVRYPAASALSETLRELSNDDLAADGYILVPLCETETERIEATAFAKSEALLNRRDVIVAVPKPLSGLTGLVQEAQRWEWVAQNTPELRDDSYANEEVSRLLTTAQQMLEKGVQAAVGFGVAAGISGLRWFYCSAPLDAKHVRDGRALLSFLSDICDEIYEDSPRIHNELINRRTLSSAAAAARMRLIERLFDEPEKPVLGMRPDKKPPEMSMYLSVLLEAQLHREVGGAWAMRMPEEEHDLCHVRPALQKIEALLRGRDEARVPVSVIFDALRRPPYGIRDGLIPLLLAVFAAIHESEIAFYEDGSFIRRMTGDDFLRLTKEVSAFDVQFYPISGVRSELFGQLVTALSLRPLEERCVNVLDVARPLLEFAATLTPYARATKTLSPTAIAVREALLRAQEPATLLFRALPKACGFKPFVEDAATENLNDPQRASAFAAVLRNAVDEIRNAYPNLHEQMKAELMNAFELEGSFEAARKQLSHRAEHVLMGLSEPRLKSFCLRLCDLVLNETPWLVALGSQLCSKPPAKWNDDDTKLYTRELHALCDQFKRFEATTFGMHANIADVSAMRVVLTQPDGAEHSRVLFLTPDEEESATRLQEQIAVILRGSGRVGLAGATRALWASLDAAASHQIPQEDEGHL